MSAKEQMRDLLDELMGTTRDGEKPRVEFDSASVCKCFLLGCCPHDILQGTRMSIGECPKMHDLALKADYERANKRKNYYFEFDALEQLRHFVYESDRRTEEAKRRLQDTQEELTDDASVIADEIHKIGEEVGTKLAKAEKLGADGHVDQSLELMKEVEALNKHKNVKEVEFRNCMPMSTYQQQKLRVCEICSAYLGIHDNDRRLADHFGGKLHLGFITIREKLAELEKICEEMRNRPRESRDRNKCDDNDHIHSRSRSSSRRHRADGDNGHRGSSSRKRHHRPRSHSRNKHGHSRRRSQTKSQSRS